jgi:hypothetical protein
MLPEVFHQYVRTPVYFINSLYDSWFRSEALKIHCDPDICMDVNLRDVVHTRTRLVEVANAILQNPNNGVFLTSCPAHTFVMKTKFFHLLSRKSSAQQGLRGWYLLGNGVLRNLTEVVELSDALRQCSIPTSSVP